MHDILEINLDEEFAVKRIIGKIEGNQPGPCVVVFAGLHGNEPSGVLALQQIIQELKNTNAEFHGSLIAVAGNLWALENSQRFHVTDLNRLWTADKIKELKNGTFTAKNKDEEQLSEIYFLLQEIIASHQAPFYFLDLHTTSVDTIPFLTVNDSLLNREITKSFPVPLILGIEEYLEGPLLNFINELGYIAFGFEAGQHQAPTSVANHKAFIYLALVYSGFIKKDSIDFKGYYAQLEKLNPEKFSFFEIIERYEIQPKEDFKMKAGFTNFQQVKKGEFLATSNGKKLKASSRASLFMPLYQSQGNDGYFLVKKTPKFFLWLSSILRKTKSDRIFPFLPGVQWVSKEKTAMLIDLRIARFIAKPLFHLFGYRAREINKNQLLIKNREHQSRTWEYKK